MAANIEVTAAIATSGRKTVVRAVETAMAQQLQPAEIVVVDTSTEYKDGLLALHPDVRTIRLPGASLAEARNAVARKAATPWIWFLDDDDVACTHHLSTLADATRAPDVGLAYAANDLLVLNSHGWSRVAGFGWAPELQRLLVLNAILPSASIVRADLAFELFDHRLGVMEDWDAWLTLRQRGAALAWSGRVTVGYVKDDFVGDSMTVAAARDARSLLSFSETYDRLCARWSGDPYDNRDRNWLQCQYRDWLEQLASGGRLAVNYYEEAAKSLLGPPVADPCCDLLALVAKDSDV